MGYEDWHTHNKYCRHAEGDLADYVKKAIELELNLIGLSDHFTYEFLEKIERIPHEEYAMLLGEVEHYLSTIEELRENYQDKIQVRVAFEVDFFKNQEEALNKHLDPLKDRLDYILGSVHILDFNDGRGAWGFDDSRFREDYLYY